MNRAPGRLQAMLQSINDCIKTLDYSNADYLIERISQLEGEVAKLKSDKSNGS